VIVIKDATERFVTRHTRFTTDDVSADRDPNVDDAGCRLSPFAPRRVWVPFRSEDVEGTK
jgi:hypothetical protein